MGDRSELSRGGTKVGKMEGGGLGAESGVTKWGGIIRERGGRRQVGREPEEGTEGNQRNHSSETKETRKQQKETNETIHRKPRGKQETGVTFVDSFGIRA